MTVSRDAVASDHLVYAWPFQSAGCEVSCGDDSRRHVPAWRVGDAGPGRTAAAHRIPRAVAAFFVLRHRSSVVHMTTMFIIPTSGQPVRLRANGRCRCAAAIRACDSRSSSGCRSTRQRRDPAQRVALGRAHARAAVHRRVVMAASPMRSPTGACCRASWRSRRVQPDRGAVFGVELMHGALTIAADDGRRRTRTLPTRGQRRGITFGSERRDVAAGAERPRSQAEARDGDTRGRPTLRPSRAYRTAEGRARSCAASTSREPGDLARGCAVVGPDSQARPTARTAASQRGAATAARIPASRCRATTTRFTQPGVNRRCPDD